ncbi:MAG: hypothetical protein AABO41_28170 [Acidobacteriota bacterium]
MSVQCQSIGFPEQLLGVAYYATIGGLLRKNSPFRTREMRQNEINGKNTVQRRMGEAGRIQQEETFEIGHPNG